MIGHVPRHGATGFWIAVVATLAVTACAGTAPSPIASTALSPTASPLASEPTSAAPSASPSSAASEEPQETPAGSPADDLLAMLPSRLGDEDLTQTVYDTTTIETVAGPVAEELGIDIADVRGANARSEVAQSGINALQFPGADPEELLDTFIDAHVLDPLGTDLESFEISVPGLGTGLYVPASAELGTPDQFVFAKGDVLYHVLAGSREGGEQLLEAVP